jgi:D-3-phosphoglycerate dehydrogenase
MKVLIADKFETNGINALEALGCKVHYDPELKDAALESAIRETVADVLVVRSTKVPAEALSAGSLSLVVRAGAGTTRSTSRPHRPLESFVSNCPGKNAVAVAELAFGLILALDRRSSG